MVSKVVIFLFFAKLPPFASFFYSQLTNALFEYMDTSFGLMDVIYR